MLASGRVGPNFVLDGDSELRDAPSTSLLTGWGCATSQAERRVQGWVPRL